MEDMYTACFIVTQPPTAPLLPNLTLLRFKKTREQSVYDFSVSHNIYSFSSI